MISSNHKVLKHISTEDEHKRAHAEWLDIKINSTKELATWYLLTTKYWSI